MGSIMGAELEWYRYSSDGPHEAGLDTAVVTVTGIADKGADDHPSAGSGVGIP